MNKNTTDGNLKKVKGSVKEALGKVMGNDGLEAEGAIERSAGKTQEKQEKLERMQEKAIDATRKDGK